MKRVSAYRLGAYDSQKDDSESMLIGFFKSAEKCREVIERYKKLPGFDRLSCTFVTKEYSFEAEETFQLNNVYFLSHEWEDSLYYHTTDIGVYLNEEEAIQEQNRLISSEKEEDKHFRMYPECFTIDNYEIDKEHWTYGFNTEPW